MKELIASLINEHVNIPKDQIINLIEIPPNTSLGDYAFPCFSLAKELRKNPVQIAQELATKIKSKDFEKVEAKGPYLNFFLNRNSIAEKTLSEIFKQKDKYGSSKDGQGKTIVIDLSAPNIAKPFGVGHLRSTIIGNSISNLAINQGYKTVKINYLGDWGTQFGKLIVGYKLWGNASKLKKDPIAHLQEIYVKVNKDESLEEKAREWFKKLEDGNKDALKLWKTFKKLSLVEFDKIYKELGVKFDVISGESLYNKRMEKTVEELKSKKLLEESEGALVVNLEKYNLGVCLIKKTDGATLYATRDITAAIDRYNSYKFSKMLYEVGAEQKLHFKQVFKVLELMGHEWAKDCYHIDHGLYLDQDGKKFSTRKGKTVLMKGIIEETKELAKAEIEKREKLSKSEVQKRAAVIAKAAIYYGDLKNYRSSDMIFDLDRFISFEGDTGPYLLYSYARARSILRKAKYKKANIKVPELNEKGKQLIILFSKFPEVVKHAYENLSPNLIANYSFELAQMFNEFYHSEQVIGSENEKFKLSLVDAFSHVLKNSLSLLGIQVLERM